MTFPATLPAPVFTLLAFVAALGILVFVHELGHFLAARRVGVRVLRFSIGFGPVIWGRTGADGTEYALSALPLGGYVKMFGEDDSEEAAADPERSFAAQSSWRRAFIVAAGPAMNFRFAFLAYAVMFTAIGVEIPSVKPVVGGLQSGSPADKAGLQVDDTVLRVDGRAVETWEAFARAVLSSGGKQLALDLARAGTPVALQVTPENGVVAVSDTLDLHDRSSPRHAVVSRPLAEGSLHFVTFRVGRDGAFNHDFG